MAEIFKAGYSRIPVWDKDPNEIIGLILTKDLIFVDPGVFFLYYTILYYISFIIFKS